MKKMKGSFSVEASIIVPVVIAVMVFALQTGIRFYEETESLTDNMQQKEWDNIVKIMYQLENISDLGEMWNGN